jgi:hypothetical protein
MREACVLGKGFVTGCDRSKHIDIQYHYIRECVEGKKVILHYVPTTEQIADIMTKCLSYDKFKKFRNQLGITIP